MSGLLKPADKPLTVQLTFRPSREVLVKDEPILVCRVLEPIRPPATGSLNLSTHNVHKQPASMAVPSAQSACSSGCDVIADIPIRVSAGAVYAK